MYPHMLTLACKLWHLCNERTLGLALCCSHRCGGACRGEYTNLAEEEEVQEGEPESQAKAAKQEGDNSNPDTASRGDRMALEGAAGEGQEGLDNQPSLAFFPADQTGYIAKVGYSRL